MVSVIQFGVWLPYARDIALALAALVTAFAAVAGLKTWRDQLSGTDERTTARALLRAVRWFAKEIEQTRARPAYPDILLMRKRSYLASFDVSVMRQDDYHERLDQLRAAKKALSDAEEDAAVLWGAGVTEDLRPLFHMSDILFETQKQLIQIEGRNKDAKSVSDAELQELERCHSVLYSSKTGSDHFGDALEKVLRALEPIYRRYL